MVVPLWVLAGAAFKLVERTPNNLPGQFLETAKAWDVDLGLLLRTLIGLELLAVVVMVFLPRLSRAMAVFMLSCFVLILLNELRRQATSCGCFGSLQIHPGVMLGIDGVLLLGVILLKPRTPTFEGLATKGSLAATLAAAAAGFALAFGVPEKTSTPQPNEPVAPVTEAPADDEDCSAPPVTKPLPPWWYAKDIKAWPGKCWRELDLFQIIPNLPADLGRGRKYVALYRRDCDHCQEMFENHFNGQLDGQVIAFRIPSEATWTLPPTTATLLDLPAQCDWVIQTPLLVVLDDGRVQCAAEGDDAEKCLTNSSAD